MMKIAFSFALSLLALSFVMGACGKERENKFEPQDRTTVSLSAREKNSAIEALKGETSVSLDTLLYSRNVRMSVLPPNSEYLTEPQTEFVGLRMLQMLSQNGLGGLNDVPGFALTARLGPVSTKATASKPQKFVTEFEVYYSVVNTMTGEVYGACAQKISGAGASEQQAVNEALKQMAPDKEVNAMLAAASEKIIDWYDGNLASFRAQVSEAESKNDLALALALLQSVPRQAEAAFAFAESRRGDIETRLMRQIDNSEFVALKQAIALSDNKPSAEVYAHYSLILPSSPHYKDAAEAMAKYERDMESRREADAARSRADLVAERQRQMELARMENSRIMAKYTAQASEQAIRLYLSQNSAGGGFWKNIGARIIGAIDGTNWQYRVSDKPYTED